MGEIIFSVCIGGFLAVAGILMNVVLRREEKQLREKNELLEKSDNE